MNKKPKIDFEKVLLDMPEAVIIENEEHEIVWVNEAARQLLKIEVGDKSVVPIEITEEIAQGHKNMIIRKVRINEKTLECKSILVNEKPDKLNNMNEKGEDVNILSILSDVSELENIADYWSKVAEEKEQLERELHSLEHLSHSPDTSVTAQMFGVMPIHKSSPETFNRFVQHYGDFMDKALEQREFKVEYDLSRGLREIAEEMGFLKASPRDVVEIHSFAIRKKTKAVTRQKAQAYIEEGRLMALELMGYLVSFYRNYSIGAMSNNNKQTIEKKTSTGG